MNSLLISVLNGYFSEGGKQRSKHVLLDFVEETRVNFRFSVFPSTDHFKTLMLFQCFLSFHDTYQSETAKIFLKLLTPFSVHRMLPFTDNAQQTWNKQPLGVILIHKMHRVGMYPCWEMDLSC